MARGVQPGNQPHYVKQKDQEIESLKKDKVTLQRILNLVFKFYRDWLKIETAELVELIEKVKRG